MVEKLIQQDRDPDRNAKATAGDDARGDWGDENNRSAGTSANAAVTAAANHAPIGFDFDLDHRRVFIEAGRGERPLAARATGLVGRKDTLFGDDGQVGIIPAYREFSSGLLTAASWRGGGWRRGRGSDRGSVDRSGSILGQRVDSRGIGQAIGRMAGLTLGAEQTLPEDANLRFEVGDARFEVRLTVFGSVEQGTVITRLLSSLIELGTIGTVRTTKGGKWSKEGMPWRWLWDEGRRRRGSVDDRWRFFRGVVRRHHTPRRSRGWSECEFHAPV